MTANVNDVLVVLRFFDVTKPASLCNHEKFQNHENDLLPKAGGLTSASSSFNFCTKIINNWVYIGLTLFINCGLEKIRRVSSRNVTGYTGWAKKRTVFETKKRTVFEIT